MLGLLLARKSLLPENHPNVSNFGSKSRPVGPWKKDKSFQVAFLFWLPSTQSSQSYITALTVHQGSVACKNFEINRYKCAYSNQLLSAVYKNNHMTLQKNFSFLTWLIMATDCCSSTVAHRTPCLLLSQRVPLHRWASRAPTSSSLSASVFSTWALWLVDTLPRSATSCTTPRGATSPACLCWRTCRTSWTFIKSEVYVKDVIIYYQVFFIFYFLENCICFLLLWD